MAKSSTTRTARRLAAKGNTNTQPAGVGHNNPPADTDANVVKFDRNNAAANALKLLAFADYDESEHKSGTATQRMAAAIFYFYMTGTVKTNLGLFSIIRQTEARTALRNAMLDRFLTVARPTPATKGEKTAADGDALALWVNHSRLIEAGLETASILHKCGYTISAFNGTTGMWSVLPTHLCPEGYTTGEESKPLAMDGKNFMAKRSTDRGTSFKAIRMSVRALRAAHMAVARTPQSEDDKRAENVVKMCSEILAIYSRENGDGDVVFDRESVGAKEWDALKKIHDMFNQWLVAQRLAGMKRA